MSKILKATHEGELKIGEAIMSVAVLENGQRIINQTSVFKAFGRPMRGSRDQADQNESKLLGLIDAKNLKPFISSELLEVIKVVEYTDMNGRKSRGYQLPFSEEDDDE